MVTTRRCSALTTLALGMAMVSFACPGKHRSTTGAQLGQVAGVLPFAISDQPGQQPPDAFLCFSDADCEVVEVRSCCPESTPTYLAVNHAAANCIVRYHDQNPCPQDPGCPEFHPSADTVSAAPTTTCAHNRCEAIEATAP